MYHLIIFVPLDHNTDILTETSTTGEGLQTGRIRAASKVYTPLQAVGVIVLSSQSKRVILVLTTAFVHWGSYKQG